MIQKKFFFDGFPLQASSECLSEANVSKPSTNAGFEFSFLSCRHLRLCGPKQPLSAPCVWPPMDRIARCSFDSASPSRVRRTPRSEEAECTPDYAVLQLVGGHKSESPTRTSQKSSKVQLTENQKHKGPKWVVKCRTPAARSQEKFEEPGRSIPF